MDVRRRAVILLVGAWLTSLGTGRTFAADTMLDKKAPLFVRMDLRGKMIDLAQLHGQVVLLNFWATWCGPCLVEMPAFDRWQKQYSPDGLKVIGISMDDDDAQARRLVAKLKVSYPVAMGDEYLGERYGGVLGLPLTYLIDRDGTVRARFQGETDLKEIETAVQALLDRH